MSTALAIASVTHILKDLLNDGLINNNATAATAGEIEVSALPPDRIDVADTAQKSRLNLYMYQATPNQGWSNRDLPSRDSHGDGIANPPLALNLHYLLTAYGFGELQGEILLGYGMQLLHENPVLTRGAIKRSLTLENIPAGRLPENLSALSNSELAEQIEQIKVTFEPVSTEEMSKLWTAFQAKYRPTAAYLVSVILIESRKPVRSPLPVLSRGEPDREKGREQGISVYPSLVPPYPTITGIVPPNQQIAMRVADEFTIIGDHLDGDKIQVLCRTSRRENPVEAVVLPGPTATAIRVRIPDQPNPPKGSAVVWEVQWPAGIYSLSVMVERTGQATRTTNSLPFVLAPTLGTVKATRDSGNKVTLTVKCKPGVKPSQQVTLVIGDQEFWSDTRTVDTNSLDFQVGNYPAGTYYYRLRVDGSESILIDRTKTPPQFDARQQVVIPS